MVSYVTPKINTEYIFYLSLVSQADTKIMQNSPTIAAGDFKVSTNGGALGNLATLPVVTPAASVMVKITLSTSEMNGDNVTLVCKDASGAQWCDLTVNIQTSARQVDDLAWPTTTGRSIDVAVTGEVGLDLGNVTGTLGNANVGWVDGSNRVDVGSWLGTAVTLSTGLKPDVNVNEWADVLLATTNPLPNVVAGQAGGIFIAGTNAATAVTTSFTVTSLVGSLTGSVDSVTNAVGSVTGAVGSVAGNVDGNVTGSVGSMVGTITTLDALDTAQDTQHANTQALLPSIITGTSTGGGSTTTLVDTGLTEGDTDYWKDSWVKFTSGVCSGQTRLITGFNLTTDTITFAPAATQVIATSVTYEIIPAALVAGIGGTKITLDDLNDIAATAIVSDGTAINTTAGAVDSVTLVATTTTNTDVTALNDVAATDIVSSGAITTAAGAVSNVTLVATTTTNTDVTALNDVAATDIVSSGAITTAAGAVSSVTLVTTTTTLTDLDTTTFAEPGQGTPGATITLKDKIGYIYKFLRNRVTTTATTISVMNDDATTVDQKSTHSDDATTYDRGEFITGP